MGSEQNGEKTFGTWRRRNRETEKQRNRETEKKKKQRNETKRSTWIMEVPFHSADVETFELVVDIY